MATYRDSITALVSNLKTLFGNTTMNEAQAIAASATKPNTIFYTSDTHNIVLGGTVYGRGGELASAIAFATDTSGMATWDTNKLYITPTSTSGTYQVYSYENNSWEMPGTITIDIPVSADAITYDLSATPDLGEGDVQSAIETVNDKMMVESDWLPGSQILSEDRWVARELRIDTTAMTATSSASKRGSYYYSNTMLPPGVTAIRLTLDGSGATTYPRELNGVPATTIKVGTNDVYTFVQSWSGAANTVLECHVSDRNNRISIQTRASAAPTAAGQLNRLASLEYKKMVTGVLKTSDVVDYLGSKETKKPLSANQGTELMLKHTGKILSTYTTYDEKAEVNGIYTNNGSTRYRPWVDVRGFRGKLKMTCSADIQSSGMRITGCYSSNLDYADLTGRFDYTVFENGITECEFDNISGDCQMLMFNISTDSAITTAQVNALWNGGISFIVQDMDFTSGDYPLNAKKWGAAGNGTTDDTKALQHLLDIGGDIYIPSGTYKVSDMLTIGDNTHIIMDSDTVLKRVTSSTTSNFCMLDTRNDVNETGYNGRHDIIIEGGIIDLNGATYTGESVGLGFQHAKNIIVRNVTIMGNRGHCIDMGGCKDVTIDECTFKDQQTAALKMESVQIDGAGGYGAWPFPPYTNDDSLPCYDGTTCINIEIKGCRFYQNAYSPAIGNHNAYRHHDINIHDNFFFGPGASAGLSRGFISFQLNSAEHNETDLVYIHDNIFRDRSNGFQFQYGPMAETEAAEKYNYGRIYVKNNMFINIANVISADSTEPAKYVLSDNVEITED